MSKYHNVAFKASHNSYDRDESIAAQLTFDPSNPANAGCSGIELDIVQSQDAWEWSVSHGGSYDKAPDKQLSAYLQQVVDWRSAPPGSDPYHDRVVTIYLDIKNKPLSNDEFPDQIDNYIGNTIAENSVFKPGELIGGEYDDLVSGAQAKGWPDSIR